MSDLLISAENEVRQSHSAVLGAKLRYKNAIANYRNIKSKEEIKIAEKNRADMVKLYQYSQQIQRLESTPTEQNSEPKA